MYKRHKVPSNGMQITYNNIISEININYNAPIPKEFTRENVRIILLMVLNKEFLYGDYKELVINLLPFTIKFSSRI